MASSTIHSFTDPAPYQAAIRGAQLEILPTKSGNFRSELTKVTFHRLWMQRADESLPRIFHGAVFAQRAAISFLTDADQLECRHCGTEVFPGEVIVDDINSMHRKTMGPCRWGSMSLPLDDLAAASETLVDHPITRPSVSMVIRPSSALMSRLLGLHETAGRLAKAAPDILSNPEVARALENELTCAMIMCLTENIRVESRISTLRHSVIMARLEEFLAAHASTPLYVAEICTAIGVSERTLRACCQEQLGMGPTHYLWLRRMHLTRQALVRAAPNRSTVTRIAADYGFWQFGRFSVEYRALFAESPSETLRRSLHQFAPTTSEFA